LYVKSDAPRRAELYNQEDITAHAVSPVPIVLFATMNVSVLFESSLKVFLIIFVTQIMPKKRISPPSSLLRRN
jgi:hypothetical protein